jgi:hypothetical protein
VTDKTASAADPVSVPGLLMMPASGTPATGSSFGAGRARDAGLLGNVTEIVKVFAVFPPRHVLVVVPAFVLLADAMRIADEESSYLVLHAEVDHGPRRLMAEITHAPLRPPAGRLLGALQFLPATQVLRAAGLLFGQLPHLPVVLALERADTASGYDQGVPSVRRHHRKMNLAHIDRCLPCPRRYFGLQDFHADVQFKAAVPDQGTGTGFLWQHEGRRAGLAPCAHWQDPPPLLFRDGLGGPVDGVEPFRSPRVLHAHRPMGQARLSGRVDGAEEGAEDRLNGLAMQGVPSPRGLLHLVLSGPPGMRLPRRLMQVTAGIPYRCRLHLGRLETGGECRGGVQSIHTYCFHILLFFCSARKVGMGRKKSQARNRTQVESLSSRPWNGAGLLAPVDKLL